MNITKDLLVSPNKDFETVNRRWRHQVPSKRWQTSTRRHDATPNKTTFNTARDVFETAFCYTGTLIKIRKTNVSEVPTYRLEPKAVAVAVDVRYVCLENPRFKNNPI
jgi:hypothetical protein